MRGVNILDVFVINILNTSLTLYCSEILKSFDERIWIIECFSKIRISLFKRVYLKQKSLETRRDLFSRKEMQGTVRICSTFEVILRRWMLTPILFPRSIRLKNEENLFRLIVTLFFY